VEGVEERNCSKLSKRLPATGTPSGVAHARKPPTWMKAGDTVAVEVERIGVLSNPVVDEA